MEQGIKNKNMNKNMKYNPYIEYHSPPCSQGGVRGG